MNGDRLALEIVEREGKVELVGRISALLREKYVYPEIAENMVTFVEGKMASGEYERVTTALEFAETLTSDLQEISKDLHLRVVFDPKRAEQLLKSPDQRGDADQREIERARKHNFGFKRVEQLKGNVGYLDLRHFFDPRIAGETAAAAMRFLAESDAVIVDLRHNGGGNPNMVQLLCSYFFGSERPVHLNSIYSRPKDKTWQYWTLPYVPGKRMPEVALYVLTSGHTFSGAEEFVYNMTHLQRGTIVGEKTAGGCNPASIEVLSRGFFMAVPHGTSINPVTQGNWEGVGIQPHIETAQEAALETAHLRACQELIECSDDPGQRQRLTWLAEEVQAHYRPVTLPESTLREYAGDYGERAVRLRDGTLAYQRHFLKFELRPLSETLFWLEGPETGGESRVEFMLDGDGNVKELTALYPDGRTMSWVKR